MPHSPADGTRKVPRRRPGAPNAHPPCASAGVDTANPGCPHTETPVPGVVDHGAGTSSWDDIGPVSGPSVKPTSLGSEGFPGHCPLGPGTTTAVSGEPTVAQHRVAGRVHRGCRPVARPGTPGGPACSQPRRVRVFAPAEGAAEPGGGPGSNHSGAIAVRGRVEPTSAQRP